MNTLASPPDNEAVVKQAPEAVDRLIARVLGGAHRRMEALDAPSEARAILHVAQFIEDVTENPS